MTTIKIWEYQKEKLDKLCKEVAESKNIPLLTYSDIIGYLIEEYEGGELNGN